MLICQNAEKIHGQRKVEPLTKNMPSQQYLANMADLYAKFALQTIHHCIWLMNTQERSCLWKHVKYCIVIIDSVKTTLLVQLATVGNFVMMNSYKCCWVQLAAACNFHSIYIVCFVVTGFAMYLPTDTCFDVPRNKYVNGAKNATYIPFIGSRPASNP